jgi:DNA polymerase-3 subunit beta
MHIQVDRDDLLMPLGRVVGVVERRLTVPILSYLRLTADGDRIALTGTDLEVEITVHGKAEIKNGGSAMVPARKLFDICRSLPVDARVELREEAGRVLVRAGRSRFNLVTLPVADFPSLQAPAWDMEIQLPQGALRNLLEQTQFCMAQQDVRYYLNGVLLDLGGSRLSAVATDGHRMALSVYDLSKPLQAARQLIIPRKGVQEIVRILGETEDRVTLNIASNHICAQLPDVTVISKLIDSRYPDYAKVIPTAISKTLTLQREPLRESLNRVAILSNDKYRGVRLAIEPNMLRISTHNPEQEEAQEEVPIDYSGSNIEVGFNVSYLLDAISSLRSESVRIGINDANSGCLITASGASHPLYVVMPMRL